MTEYYNRFDLNGDSFLIVTSVVDDPEYLSEQIHHQRTIQTRTGCIQMESSPMPPSLAEDDRSRAR